MATATQDKPWEVSARVTRLWVDEKGCTVYLASKAAAGMLWARFTPSHGNYNALYSALLSCWLNKAAVLATVSRRLDAADERHVNLASIEVGEYADSKFD